MCLMPSYDDAGDTIGWRTEMTRAVIVKSEMNLEFPKTIQNHEYVV